VVGHVSRNLEDEPAIDRQPYEVLEAARAVGVLGDDEQF
jgi:hypothetical protein